MARRVRNTRREAEGLTDEQRAELRLRRIANVADDAAPAPIVQADISDVSASAGEVNLLDLSGLTVGWALLADGPSSASWQALPPGVTDHTMLTSIGINTHAAIDAHIADASIHFTAASLALDTTYLRLDTSNDPLTGTLTTQAILPTADNVRDIGSSSVRFRDVNAWAVNAVEGANSFSRVGNSIGGVLGGRNIGPGTNTLQMGGGLYPPTAMFANVFTLYANQTSTMSLLGGGSFMAGSAFCFYGANDRAEMICDSYAFASFTGGYAYPSFGSSNMTIRVQNSAAGSFLWAYPSGNGNGKTHEARNFPAAGGGFTVGTTIGPGSAYLWNVGAGSFCQGLINASNASGKGYLRTGGQGAFAQGNVSASDVGQATINASGPGCFAQGNALGASLLTSLGQGSFAQGRTANTATIQASSRGSFAQGTATGSGGIYSSGQGSLAHGRTFNAYTITASGSGAFAVGDTTTAGPSIIASADNSFQFGPGTNAIANSLQVGQTGALGTGIHFHAGGAPPAPVNGDMWVTAAGVVTIQSGGVACACTNAVM